MKLTNSPVDLISLFDREVFIKRDDLLHPEFSGNKARKFKYFLDHDFPDVSHIVGFGSCQANSLYSLSALAKLRNWRFSFYVDRIPEHLKAKPRGNYAAALGNGAVIEIFPDQLNDDQAKEAWLEQHFNADTLTLPEGGRCEQARYGVYELAKEIHHWAENHNHQQLKVFLPSGTGTTALFLQEYFVSKEPDIEVLTCAVVGSSEYLRSQFELLNPDTAMHPKILDTPKQYHFGKLNQKLYQTWKQACQSGVEFELLYDPVGLITLKEHLSEFKAFPLMYLHQGGLKANETMLPRYKRKFGD